MMSLKEQYSELLALTKNYLLQEYAVTDRILAESDTYSHFRTYALQQQEMKKTENTVPVRPVSPSAIQQPSMSSLKPNPNIHLKKPEMGPAPTQTTPLASIALSPIRDPKVVQETPLPSNQEKKGVKNAVEHGPSKAFVLAPPASIQKTDFTELRKTVQEKFPHLHLLDTLPDDAEAKKLANGWAQQKPAPQILILSFDETAKHLAFLENITKALAIYGLNVQIANAVKLERENEWTTRLKSQELKLVIASSTGFYNLSELQKHYREGAKQGRHYLNDRPLLLLSDLGFYLKEPSLKASLWAALKEFLVSIPVAP
jgi:hypothetical protein